MSSSSTTATTAPKIALIGAGPSSLTLAALLLASPTPLAHPPKIFELDPSPTARPQGGTLDLHPRGGQLALRAAGLWDAFIKHARPESDVMKVVRLDGKVLWDGNVEDVRNEKREDGNGSAGSDANALGDRPEIDREVLRKLLLDAVGAENVKWGKGVKEVVPGEAAGTWDLLFADGTSERGFDLVVGGDGAWSKVRPLLTDVKPSYSGISLIELWALDVEKKQPWMAEFVGAGSCFSFGEGRTVQIQRIGDGSIRTYACLRSPESFIKECGIDWLKPEEARKEFVSQYFSDCGADLKRMILESGDKLIPRALYHLPVGMRWNSRAGLTLIGDAAHLMTPFAGVGVNAAMVDALELSKAVVGFVEGKYASLEEAVRAFEEDMFPRGEMFAKKTLGNLEKHFSEGGSEHLAGRLRGAYGKK